MKTVLIVFGVLALIALLAIGSCVFMFSRVLGAPAQAADEFVAKIATGDLRGAYDATDPRVKSAMDFDAFAATAKRIRLDQVQLVKWRSTNVTPPTANLSGVADMRGGGTAAIEATITEADGWRVSSISVDGEQLTVVGSEIEVDDEIAAAAALKTLLQWNNAIKSQDFTAFYANIADLWKQETNPAELKQAFARFIELQADISGIADVKPMFTDAPQVDDNGNLVMAGYYPTSPLRVHFELRYTLESGDWKLIHINVRLAEE